MSTYKQSGIDIEKANKLVDFLKKKNPSIGGFGGAFPLKGFLQEMNDPLLVSGADGVGTKIMLARQCNSYSQIGIDLVAMSVNDILTCGATPLFFLDYLAVGKIDLQKDQALLDGIIEGCRLAHCTLLGGETAEMPGMYEADEVELAGFAVGLVDKKMLLTGESIQPGDILVGFPSSGLHSNGYTLVRHIIDKYNLSLDLTPFDENTSLGEILLTPTKIYSDPCLDLFSMNVFKGLAHITGGGIPGNLQRILPEYTQACLDKRNWDRPPVFSFLQEKGNIKEEEMFKVFNMGLGMIGVIASESLVKLKDFARQHNEDFYIIGSVDKNDNPQPEVHIN